MANIALYEAGTTDFFSQGMGVLSDVISSTSTETASTTGNESSKLELQYPVGGFLANKLTEGRFVRVSRSIDSSDYAIFEITDTLRDDSGVITIYGTPYSDRLGRMSFENGGKFKEYHSVQVALDAAKAQMKGFPSWFQLTSDLSQAVDFTKDQPYENFSKFLEALNAKVGGNIYYGLTNIRIYSKRGTDRTDIVLRDDLNTKAIKVKTDYTKIVNRIIPLLPVKDEKGNDTQETQVGAVVESGYANNFIDYWAGTVIQVKTQDEANTYFNRTKIDRPTQTVTVDPIELDIDLSDVQLFDQISVYSSKLDFTNKLRVSERTIDNLTGEVTAFKLGDTSPSIVASIVQSNQDIFNQIKEIGNSVISANGKNQLFFGSKKPRNPHEGDLWYKEVDGESYMMVYHNGEWVEVISTKFKELLDKQISEVLQSSKEYSDNLNTAIAGEVGKIKSDVNTQLQTAKTERDDLNAKAEAIKQDVNTRLEAAALDRKKLSDESKQLAKAATDHADDLFTQANTNAKTEAQNALQSANEALDQAKQDLNGGISNVHSETVKNAGLIAGKVSQSDYNTKTGELDSKVGTAQVTANEAKTELAAYKKTADGNISANKAEITATNKLIKEKVSQSVYDARTKTVDTKMGQFSIDMKKALTQISEVTARVNDLNQINQLYNTEFSPDLQGWDCTSTDGKHNPYPSYLDRNVKAATVGFWTVTAENPGNGYFSRFQQIIPLGNAGNGVLSVSWQSYIPENTKNLYCHLWIKFYDKDGKPVYNSTGDNEMADWAKTGQKTWERQKKENIEIPTGAVKVAVSFETREGIRAYLVRPMLVFDSKIGSYVPGNYNNNARVASVEVALDGITELVKDPKNGLSAVRTLAANGQTLAIEARDKANANAQAITKVTTTANGTQTTVSKMTGQVSELETKQTQTANQVTTEIDDRKSGDKAVETAMKNLVSTQITSVTKGYQTLNQQTEQSFNTKIKTITNQINDMGQVNLIKNSEFNPDLEGWYTTTEGSGSTKEPYRSYYQGNIKATVVGFDTTKADASTWSSLLQRVELSSTTGSGNKISLSWSSWARVTANYNGLHVFFYDNSDTQVGDAYKEWASPKVPEDNSYTKRKVFEGIVVPDTARYLILKFQAREGTGAYLGQVMLTYGDHVGSYTPGPYNNNATVESNRLQLVNMIQDKVEDYTKKIEAVRTTTAKQITDEVKDRKNGDSTVTSNLSKMIDQRATSLKTGYESYFNQQSQSIIMGVGTPNQLKNTNFSPDLDGWNVSSNKSDNSGTFYRSIMDDYGRNAVGVNTTNINGSDTNRHYAYLEQDINAPGWKDGTVVSISWHIQVRQMLNYAWLWVQFLDGNKNHMLKDDGSQASYGYNYGATGNNADGRWHDGSFENIRAPKGTVYIRVSFQAREGSNLYLTAPMVTFTSKAAAYVPGPYSHTGEQTVLNLLKEKWSIGIADNAGRIISGINGDRSGLAIIAKKVTISQDTVVQGTSWLSGAVIKDASISRAKIGKLNVSDADVINMNVSKLSGNINHFVVSHVNTLDAKVLYGNTGHLGTTDTGRVINQQDNHLQLASKGMYNSSSDRAQLELLNYSDNSISDEMKGSINFYSHVEKGGAKGIRIKNNHILAVDEGTKGANLYLSPYQGGQVRAVSRDLKAYYAMCASSFKVSSLRKFKRNIQSFDETFEDSALDIVNNTDIHTYTKDDQQEIGVIADEADERILSEDNSFVDLYSYASVLYKAVQELSQQVEELKNGKPTSKS